MTPLLTLSVVGDVCFAGDAAKALDCHGPGYAFEKVRHVLGAADIAFCNLESPVLPPGFPSEKLDPAGLWAPPSALAALKDAGFTVVNFANNHALDLGATGLVHTLKALAAGGFAVCGAGEDPDSAHRLAVVEKKGCSVGFLGFLEDCNYTFGVDAPGPAYFSLAKAKERIAACRQSVDVLVVSVHADIEFRETPSVPRQAYCRALVDAGADLVLCHHPHVPQGIEKYGRGWIAYSLGNFLFDVDSNPYLKSNSVHCFDSFILQCTIAKDGVRAVERIPARIALHPEHRPYLLEGAARDELAAYFAHLDALCADPATVAARWRETALNCLAIYWDEYKGTDLAQFKDDLLWRIFCVDENKAWAEEVLVYARERFAELKKNDYTFQRPNFRFQKPPTLA
ncbi:MAG: hypothetical protein A2268_05825 [Candidatus Raymondbacteria bacterium RifOxyA12_full_50_37]|uniref:Capsule synthesis protein CapA domain-containing protein n=1 Tax=Candidatus Raymondbacteria bacterium RIFOXYD12_FULL_49_13 TaxID=1817890 RepID=A0A1F7FFG1_UNCRA|nr:MAG: hypothetical protein A2268_05825 [Candidatus Raymondbacteria bacterium RifOxyA12_full_50_37]OGJ94260.1 MAG: hypothetical protein A2248_14755 [Candidatus Raymondbacteria bacterium RIFOXYA2_FULL_49_16]OGJ94779.1 MAG: hypothetical protein A2487_01940 [Candidatus Raymondbacteria bacterium RifOxyC12_full_50_8]OGJ99090.1 MAG: hypothetical protein A2453_11165 [Candidatus Raymondbacteria bacterium RIFOXYC2_FULL_50_21]OGK01188.1 MAG: hypothetical protein A2350_01645 [Candidatus Raymondbacteria b